VFALTVRKLKNKIMKNILYISSLIILLFSCSKDKNKESCFKGRDKGDGTISFYVDGKLWQNSCEFNNDGSINGTANESMNVISYDSKTNFGIEGTIWNSSKIYLGLTTLLENETCEVGNCSPIYEGIFDSFDVCKISLYFNNKEYVSKRDNGFIKTTKFENYQDSSTGKWVFNSEGIFEATLFNVKDSTDFVKITDGFWNN
jgi:hypothetical protein